MHAATLGLATLVSSAAVGAELSWTFTGANGTWQTASNWTGSTVPVSPHDAAFSLNSSGHTVTLVGAASPRNLLIKNDNVTFSGAGTLLANGSIGIGGTPQSPTDATLNIATGSFVRSLGVTQASSLGTLIVGGGTLYTRDLDLAAAASLTFASGTIVVDGGVLTPRVSNGTYYYAPAPAPPLTYIESLVISGATGSASRPTLSLTGGATCTLSGALHSYTTTIFAGNSGGKGAISVDGPGSMLRTQSGGLFVGGSGGTFGGIGGTFVASDGSLSITNGGFVEAHDPSIIGGDGGIGRAIATGTLSTLNCVGGLYVGRDRFDITTGSQGDGSLSITNGASLILGNIPETGDSLFIGSDGGVGKIQVNGPGANITATNNVIVGDGNFGAHQADGLLVVSNAGQATFSTAMSVGGRAGMGRVAVSAGTLAVGGILQVGYGVSDVGGGVFIPGSGTFSASNQATITARSTIVGASGGVGSLILDNASLANTTSLYVGNSPGGSAGSGFVSLLNAASLTNGGILRVYAGGTLSIANASLTTQDLDISQAGAGGFDFASGTIAIDGGVFNPRSQEWNLTGAATTSIGPTLRLQNGAISVAVGTVTVGQGGGVGTLLIDGTNSRLLTISDLEVGSGTSSMGTPSSGSLHITSGGSAASIGDIEIGNQGNGLAVVNGPNSSLASTSGAISVGYLNIAPAGGTLLVSSGAQASSASEMYIGRSGTGRVTVNAGGLNIGGDLQVGTLDTQDPPHASFTPAGSLTISNSGVATCSSNALIGTNGSAGTVTVAGGTFSVSNRLQLGSGSYQLVGRASSAVLSVLSGGTISTPSVISSGSCVIGSSGASGTASLSGSGSTWTNTGNLLIGNDGSGTVTAGLGTLQVNSSAKLINGGTTRVHPTGTLIVNGGMLSTRTLDLNGVNGVLTGAGSVSFTAGTITIDVGEFMPRGGFGAGSWQVSSSTGTPTLNLINGAAANTPGAAIKIGSPGETGAINVGTNSTLVCHSITVFPLSRLTASSGAQIAGHTAGSFINQGTVQLSNDAHLSIGTFTNQGTVQLSDARLTVGTINLQAGAMTISGANSEVIPSLQTLVQPGAVLNVNGGTMAFSSLATLVNSGTINQTGGEIDAFGPLTLNTNSVLSISGGVFSCNPARGVVVNGRINVFGNGTVDFLGNTALIIGAGSVDNHGVIRKVATAGTTTFGADLSFNGGNPSFADSGGDADSEMYMDDGCTVAIAGTFSNATNGTLTKSGLGTLLMSGKMNWEDESSLLIQNGTVQFLGQSQFASQQVRLSTLTLGTGTACLDLNDNDLLLQTNLLPQVHGWISTARNGGAWDGRGITSSAARVNPQHSTTLGILSGSDYRSVHGDGATFDDHPVSDTDVLVKYTWYGDTELNGLIDFDDYVRIDNGFNLTLGGWLNGDFDLNGVIDFDDYVLIDLGFNGQNDTLRRVQDYLDGTDRSSRGMDDPATQMVIQHFEQFGIDYAVSFLSAVPEPAVVPYTALFVLLSLRRSHGRSRTTRAGDFSCSQAAVKSIVAGRGET